VTVCSIASSFFSGKSSERESDEYAGSAAEDISVTAIAKETGLSNGKQGDLLEQPNGYSKASLGFSPVVRNPRLKLQQERRHLINHLAQGIAVIFTSLGGHSYALDTTFKRPRTAPDRCRARTPAITHAPRQMACEEKSGVHGAIPGGASCQSTKVEMEGRNFATEG
jgi:hypothetical protein